MATGYDRKRREHLEEAKRTATATLEPPLTRMVQGVAEQLDE